MIARGWAWKLLLGAELAFPATALGPRYRASTSQRGDSGEPMTGASTSAGRSRILRRRALAVLVSWCLGALGVALVAPAAEASPDEAVSASAATRDEANRAFHEVFLPAARTAST